MFEKYDALVCLDFEFRHDDGEPAPQEVACCVAHDLQSDKRWRLTGEECRRLKNAPYPTGPNALFICWNAVAELSCHAALSWKLPAHVLDLMVCHRAITNGFGVKANLVAGLNHYGLKHLAANEKEELRALAMQGGPYSMSEMQALLEYCETDVIALAELLPKMAPLILTLPNGLPGCLMWGRYMKAVMEMQATGIPLDNSMYQLLHSRWPDALAALTANAHDQYGVFPDGGFNFNAFENLIQRLGIPWERTKGGRLNTKLDYWKRQGKMYPRIKTLANVMRTRSQNRELRLTVGSDGRNRTWLSPFVSKTSRNAPSTNRFVMNCPGWMRGLVTPPPGRALIVSDYTAEEPWIMGVLAGDDSILGAYADEGDFYLNVAHRMDLCERGATKATHADLRSNVKILTLAASYGMGKQSAATLMGVGEGEAESLMRKFRKSHRRYFEWIKAELNATWVRGSTHTRFGWPINVPPDPNERSFMNFPLQAHGADILRIVCCELTERGYNVCFPLHDSVGVEVPLGCENDAVIQIESIMIEAAGYLGTQVPIRVESKILRPGERYLDSSSAQAEWDSVMAQLGHSSTATFGRTHY